MDDVSVGIWGLSFWVLFTILVGVVANRKKRFVFGWVVFSLILGPLIPLLILTFLSKVEKDTLSKFEKKLLTLITDHLTSITSSTLLA